MLERAREFLDAAPTWLLATIFLIGVALLLIGGKWVVDGAIRTARRLGVSALLIGLTVVAFGTSAPELAFNLIAALNGNPDLSFGNIVGSNIANIGLVLGASAVLATIHVHSRIIKRELPLLILVSIGLLGLSFAPIGTMDQPGATMGFSRIEGGIMLVGFGIVMAFWWRLAQLDRADPLLIEAAEGAAHEPIAPLPGSILLIIIGLAALVGGGKVTETGAVGIASRLGWSQGLIGLTIVAIATSLPEAITSLLACVRGHADLAVGNVVGSNLFNILLILGATCAFTSVPIPAERGWFGFERGLWDLAVMIGLTAVLLPISMTNQRRIMIYEGVFLLLAFAGYLTARVLL